MNAVKAVRLSELTSYRHTRGWISGVVFFGISISVLLNVQHAPKAGGWVALLVGGFPPAAVFLCIEIISRVPMFSKWSAGGRIVLALGVSGGAAWISYEAQAEYVKALGFTGTAPLLLPAIIDGLMGVATISLVEVSSAIRKLLRELAEMDLLEATESAAAPTITEPAKPAGNRHRGRKPGPQNPAAKRRALPRTALKPAPAEKEPLMALPIEATVVTDIPASAEVSEPAAV